MCVTGMGEQVAQLYDGQLHYGDDYDDDDDDDA